MLPQIHLELAQVESEVDDEDPRPHLKAVLTALKQPSASAIDSIAYSPTFRLRPSV
jgi:hypothetical protein